MKSSGFTLLESIVALVILSAIGISVLSWVSQSSLSVSRLLERERDANLQKSLVAIAGLINPRTSPSGQIDFDTMMINWTTVSRKPLDNLLNDRLLINQDLSMFTLSMTVKTQTGDVLIQDFQIDQPGYQRVVVQP